MSLRNWLRSLFSREGHSQTGGSRNKRGPATHVIILDGTMSSLEPGYETHAGQLYKLLREVSSRESLTVYYEPGIQWKEWRATLDVMQGRGINKQIKRAYGVLATRYRAGDKIVLAGYSRGAYAARSIAGVIELMGLVKSENATERMIQLAYRHYCQGGRGAAAEAFRNRHCHASVEIEAVAVWDTVKALGFRLPFVWRWSNEEHAFHNHALGGSVKNGFHALALDETREAYTPVLWAAPPGWEGRVEQVWFPGSHGDIGGQIDGVEAVRPFSNLSLVWMLGKLEKIGLPLPDGWAARFPTDPSGPSIGNWRGWSKLFLSRRARTVGQDPSERMHPSANLRGGDVPALEVSH